MNHDLIEKEKKAIERLRVFEPQTEPYFLCYSGGKDSDVIRILASVAGVKHEIVNNHTTVDAPETVRYIRTIPNVKINYPERTMWQLIVDKRIPPTRLARYCCAELKEQGGKFRVKITGVRWEESSSRARNAGVIRILGKPKMIERLQDEFGTDGTFTEKGGFVMNNDNDKSRELVEHCYRTTATMVNPIIEWTESDVWEYLRHYGVRGNPLYKMGFKRVGCIGCPMAKKCEKEREFRLYPKYKQAYIHAFDRMLKKIYESGGHTNANWQTGEEVFHWWMENDVNQLSIFDMEEENNAEIH